MHEEDCNMNQGLGQWRKDNVSMTLSTFSYSRWRIDLITIFVFVLSLEGYDRLDDPKDMAAHPAPTKVGNGSIPKPSDSGDSVK